MEVVEKYRRGFKTITLENSVENKKKEEILKDKTTPKENSEITPKIVVPAKQVDEIKIVPKNPEKPPVKEKN
eukprot:UN02228